MVGGGGGVESSFSEKLLSPKQAFQKKIFQKQNLSNQTKAHKPNKT